MPEIGLHAFIDESGQRARTKGSSAHFVMSAAIVPAPRLPDAAVALEEIRGSIHRKPGQYLAWKNIKAHSQRLCVVQSLAALPWLTVSSVVVCKEHLADAGLNDDMAYLYTLRYLLERLSWFARDQQQVLSYTLGHVVRFQMAKLRAYEQTLRGNPDCKIAWGALDPKGGAIEQPQRNEMIQLADLVASATGAAFNLDDYGNTENRYLCELAPRLYRRGNGLLTSYGLKMHPWSESTRAAYPWVAAL